MRVLAFQFSLICFGFFVFAVAIGVGHPIQGDAVGTFARREQCSVEHENALAVFDDVVEDHRFIRFAVAVLIDHQ